MNIGPAIRGGCEVMTGSEVIVREVYNIMEGVRIYFIELDVSRGRHPPVLPRGPHPFGRHACMHALICTSPRKSKEKQAINSVTCQTCSLIATLANLCPIPTNFSTRPWFCCSSQPQRQSYDNPPLFHHIRGYCDGLDGADGVYRIAS